MPKSKSVKAKSVNKQETNVAAPTNFKDICDLHEEDPNAEFHTVYLWAYDEGGSTRLSRNKAGQFFITLPDSDKLIPATIAEALLWYAGQESKDVIMDGSGKIGELLLEAANVINKVAAITTPANQYSFSKLEELDAEASDAVDALRVCRLIHSGLAMKMTTTFEDEEGEREDLFGAVQWFDNELEGIADRLNSMRIRVISEIRK
jgi:hypothetical protein